jgi:Carboxypeptidase regulatory-like domain
MGTTQWMTKKTKKKRFNPVFESFRHPFSTLGHLTLVRLTIVLFGMICLAGATFAIEPGYSAQNSSGSHAHDFVIFATVFNDQGFAFLGARARVRHTEEKKFRWEATSDHQGELAFRVPPSAEYELTIEARGFKTQTRKIDARVGNRTDLTIRMEPQSEPHTEPGTGGKP